MTRWPRPQIRYLARMGTGHTPSRSHPEYWEDCTIPWLTLADVHQLRDGTQAVVDDTSEKISVAGVRNSSAVPHPAGTVAMSRTASVGFTCIMGKSMATSQDFVTWTCGESLDNRFLLWALRGERAQILSRMQGSTHKTIYMPDLEDLRISLPPLTEQRAIADYLDAETARIDALIAKKQQLILLLEERRQAHLERILWRGDVAPLKFVADVVPGYAFPSEGFRPDGNGPRLLRGANVGIGRLDWSDSVSLVGDAAPHQRYVLTEHDVVLGMDRPFISRGTRVSEIGPGDAGCLLVQRVCRLRPVRSIASVLVAAIRSPRFRAYIESDLTGVSVPHLSDEQIGGFAVPVAQTGALAESIGSVNSSVDRLLSPITHQLELLAEHRQALITAAVTGEFAVPGAA